ncbi:hypothetical protein RintRC_5969 [Richelia intracellularis]|nr:hypothetical protein RintRC_5969 [Richelia intracellularis]
MGYLDSTALAGNFFFKNYLNNAKYLKYDDYLKAYPSPVG